MPAFTSMPVRTKILKWAFAQYAVLSLISMAPMNIGAALLAIAILLTSKDIQSLKIEFKSEWKHSWVRLYTWLTVLLTTALAISLLYGLIHPMGYGGNFVEIHFFKDMAKVWYLFWPLFLMIGFRRLSVSDRWFVVFAWVLAFGCLSAIGIVQRYTGWPRFQPIPGEPNRYHATLFLGHHLSVASIFIFPFFCTLDLLRIKQKLKAPQIPYGALALIATLGCVTLILTYSRTLWGALPIGILAWTVWSLPRRKSLILIPVLLVAMFGVGQIPQVQRRIQEGMGIGERKDLWSANLDFFKQRPFTGVGWHHPQELSGYYLMEKYHTKDVFSGHAHNNFLEMLGGTGLLGTSFWLAWCFGVFLILLKKGSSSSNQPSLGLYRGLACAWIVFHINGLTQVNFWEGKVEHQMAWAILLSLF
jgi:O-antigen ligase